MAYDHPNDHAKNSPYPHLPPSILQFVKPLGIILLPPHTLTKSLHQMDRRLLIPSNAPKPPPTIIFDIKTLFHNPSPSLQNSHLHFARRAKLNKPIFLMSNPPKLFGLHPFSHDSQATFFFPSSPPNKKFLCMDTTLLTTLLGILKKERKNKEKEDTIEFTKHTQPTK